MNIIRFSAVWLLLAVFCGNAQDTRGTLLGRVLDSSNAVVPNVDVRAINEETGIAAAGRSNQAGNYVIPYLLPGTYRIEAELVGFKKFTRAGVQVRVNDSVSVDVTMTPGTIVETVDVKATTPLLEGTTASLGQVIDQKRILDLPLGGGNSFALALLAPGAASTVNLRYKDAARPDATSNFVTDGNRAYGNEFSIDGVPDTASYGSEARVAFVPQVSAISEFKVQTANYDASIGHTAGSVINVSIKSGTNGFHGELHEFLRNRVLDAKDFFQNRSGQTLPVYQYNRFGLAAGGPVVIPGKYNGRNRTFWFYAFEQNPNTEPAPGTYTVPNAAELRGDFSGLLRLGSQYQIYDPATIVPATGGRFRRSPFAGNMIPASRISSLALNLARFWPAPNIPGTSDGRNNFFNGAKQLSRDYVAHLWRADHSFSENHRLAFRMNYDNAYLNKDHHFQNNANGTRWNTYNKGLALDDVRVLSPTLTLNTRYGLTYMYFPCWKTSRGLDLAELGFSRNLAGLTSPDTVAMPYININGFTGFGNKSSNLGIVASTTHSLSTTVNKLVGSHMVRFGGEYRNMRSNINQVPTADTPDLAFDTTWTKGPLDNSPAGPMGQGLATFLLGLPSGGRMMRSGGGSATQDQYLAFYVQDDWKVLPKLTLNFGVRYEHETPITERYNRSADQFDFTVANPIESAARAKYSASPIPELPAANFTARGGLLFTGVNGRSRYLWDSRKTLFMPRFGLAYQLRPTTILRSGYGIFFDTIGSTVSQPLPFGFDSSTPVVPSLDNGLSFIASLADPFPNGLTAPVGSAGGYSTYVGQSVAFYPRRREYPYAQRWSFGIQQQMKQVLLDISYVGNRGTHLQVSREYNAVPAQYLSTLPARDQAAINFLSAQVKNPFAGLLPNTGLNGTNVSRSQLLRPYPEFTGIEGVASQGYSWYHSLQVRAERRFGKGYTVNAAYTWSKSMGALGYLNDTDPMPERVITAQDRTHRLVISGIYELPFGKGRHFGSGARGFRNALLGGWQVQALVSRQSGAPIGFGNAIFNGNFNDIVLSRDRRSVDKWFNTDAGFERASNRQLASNIRTMPSRFSGIRSEGQHVWDASAFKIFPITEDLKLQFRGEAYNALNHPNFNSPNTTPTNSNFGKVTGAAGPPRQWQLALKLLF
ncbi:MAG: TonB-dependent receptor [Acidobacteria bacterium]|nr:TonB-dependent receptor [Acidobacteriota bacterium]